MKNNGKKAKAHNKRKQFCPKWQLNCTFIDTWSHLFSGGENSNKINNIINFKDTEDHIKISPSLKPYKHSKF